jgi:hypothetical protein
MNMDHTSTTQGMPHSAAKDPRRRARCEKVEVRGTGAIRRAKPWQEDGRSRYPSDEFCPLMFPAQPVMRIPDLHQVSDGPQKINVPMGPGPWLLMVGDPCAQASRSEGAPNIDIESGMHVELPEPTNLQRTTSGGGQNKCVGTRCRSQLSHTALHPATSSQPTRERRVEPAKTGTITESLAQ